MSTKRPENSIAQYESGKSNVGVLDPNRDRTIDFVSQAPKDKQLFTYTLDEGTLSTPSYVGDAMERTFAAILVHGDQDDGVIQDHHINDDFVWGTGSLATLKVSPRKTAGFTAIYGMGSVRLYIQNSSGELQELIMDGATKKWQQPRTLEGTKAMEGEAISAVGTENEVAVFYANEDKSVHQVVYRNGAWNDTEVPATKETTTAPILVTAYSPSPGNYTLQYTNDIDEVYEVENGRKTQIGKITKDDQYQPKTTAQHGGGNPV
ncbi:uncharacterized protein BDR25DRAFT_319246 [Lindgomyces ingoldianus]|uniref:Uncharacterized protein n=1 Tax=Lindgomyces ingoldianus TaxID=673940 RepID=A0ACB6QE28_9PLEO|nr:uncharacterized protein BDR25DRAFT_319246 [Lindgomyces ingoldianus]KAF2464377.1 hypothetical protein BDR25DRAFT_319246 [Lindgomyces ingoldianus]